jgi:hypothetical protein
MPLVAGCEEIEGEAGLAAFKKLRVRPGDFEVSAFHPLGTCRMGTDPSRSCIGPDGEAHDVAGLFVADGSAVPSSLGVNPQMTIMALALRTAEALDARLDRLAAPPPPVRKERSFCFAETMSGHVKGGDTRRPFSFSLRARARSLGDFARTREVAITGELMAEGFGARCPLEGTLGMDVLRTGRLPYAFTFTADDGKAYRFVGEKKVSLLALRRSMTWLPGRILDAGDRVVGEAEVTFDLRRDLVDFLGSFRLT